MSEQPKPQTNQDIVAGEHTPGLSLEQQDKAAELYEAFNTAALGKLAVEDEMVQRLSDNLAERGHIRGLGDISTPAQDIRHTVQSFRFKRAQKRGAKHYRAHESAYQEQALIDAKQAGYVPTGWEEQ